MVKRGIGGQERDRWPREGWVVKRGIGGQERDRWPREG